MEFKTLLPPLRSGERGATKRYASLADGRLHFTGTEVVRSDWTEVAHEVQRELYGRLLAGDPVDDYLRQVIDEVSARKRDRQLVYRKALRKEAGDYRALPPHVVAARKREAAAAGERRGVIKYVITVTVPEPAGRPAGRQAGQSPELRTLHQAADLPGRRAGAAHPAARLRRDPPQPAPVGAVPSTRQ